MPTLRIGDVITRSKEKIMVEDDQDYQRVTIRLNHKGVTLRDIEKGINIGTKQQYLVQKGQFIMSRIDARNGAFGTIPAELEGAIVTNDFLAFDINNDLVTPFYFSIFSQTTSFLDAAIRGSTGTTNRKRLKEEIFLNLPIKIPDLEQQKRIIQRYQCIQEKNQAVAEGLKEVNCTLNQLRQNILKEAVQGKLVPRDVTDEPASELLKKIQAEKDRLIKEKKIKKEKPLPPIKDEEETPFEVPKDWEWTTIKDIAFVTKLAGFEYTKHIALKETGAVPVIRAQNVKMNRIDETNLLYIEQNVSNLLERSALTKKCILMTFIGAGIGDVAIFNKERRYHLAPNVAKIEIFNTSEVNLLDEYILYYLMSPIGINQIHKFLKATAQPSLSMQTIRQVLIAIPPLNEQKRIVRKVEQLMHFCDELEESIAKAQANSELLMQAILQEAFSGN